MTLTIKLDGNWSSFQLANSAPPLSVIDSAIAPSARIPRLCVKLRLWNITLLCQCARAGQKQIILYTSAMYLRKAIVPKDIHLASLKTKYVGSQSPRNNLGSHIDASHSRQPLVKGERMVRYEVNAVMAKVVGQYPWPNDD